jgi:hypothetical protein
MLKKNLCAIVNARFDPCGGAWITPRNVADDRFDVAGSFLGSD